jgi:DUF4097 and DUF4098 domain-containing protein YvlB
LPLFTATETISEVFDTGDAPTIVVETFNGSIDISDGEDDEVVVEIEKRASGFDQSAAENSLGNIEISLIQDVNEIRITARQVGHTFGNCGASVIIAAPKGAKVVLKSTNAYIVSEGMQGGIDAQTSNGKIEVYKGRGPIKADSSNGTIRIEATDAVVDAHTSNARIRFQGTLAEDEHRFKTSNGRIDVILPEDSQFHFQAASSNGRIDCEFPYESDRSRSRRKKSGTVGDDPHCSISLATSNGSIDIRRDE